MKSPHMKSPKGVGRTIGLLLLVHFITGLTVNFILLKPVIAPPGFLANAAASSFQVRLYLVLSFVSGLVMVGIAIEAFPVFRRYSQAMALWFLALSVVTFSLQAVENGTVLSMLSLSQDYAKANVADAGLFQALAPVVGSARLWAHFLHLLVLGLWIFVLYSVLCRFALIPRTLAVFALLTIVLQITGVTLPPLFFGYHSVPLMAMPMALSYPAVALWLVVRGFDEGHYLVPAKADGVELSGA